jgi:antitoxin CptB
MHEARLKRARLRAWRRGFREADLILGPFADAHVGTMSETELAGFERLLDVPDHDLYAWIMRGAAPPEFDNSVFAALKASAWAGPAPART